MAHKIAFKYHRTEDSLGFMFWQVTNLWQRNIIKALQELDLTHVQFVLLAVTGWLTKEHTTGVTQTMVAHQAKTDIMMTSKVLRTLEAKGFITRKEHPTDTRAKTLMLTKKGKELLQQAIVIVDTTDDLFFDVLSSKESTLFLELIGKILDQQKKRK